MPNIPAAEWDITPDVVRALLAEQCPDLAGLEITRYSHGWDNDLYRLGDSFLVRLPRRALAARLIDHETRWLPTLADHLTVWTPQPVFVGRPTDAFPAAWAIAPFLPARNAADVAPAERTPAARGLADFLISLHLPAPLGAPENPHRGLALDRPDMHERALARIAREERAPELEERWRAWSRAPEWDGADLWLHGDLHPLNILLDDAARLAGVIDWGDMTSGDPAVDLAAGWLTFDETGRRVFVDRCRQSPVYDEHAWDRARAWALLLGLLCAQQADDMPRLQRIGHHALAALLAEPVAA